MRLSARLIISLILGIALVSFLFALTQVRGQKRALRNELGVRAEIEAKTLESAVESMLGPRDRKDLNYLLEQFKEVQHIPGAAVYDVHGAPLALTTGLAQLLPQAPNAVAQAVAGRAAHGEFVELGKEPAYVFALPLHDKDATPVESLFQINGKATL